MNKGETEETTKLKIDETNIYEEKNDLEQYNEEHITMNELKEPIRELKNGKYRKIIMGYTAADELLKQYNMENRIIRIGR